MTQWTASRPTAVTVIGWGAIVVALLMALGGAMAALLSSTMPEIGSRPVHPTPVDFVFKHFTAFAASQVLLAFVLGAAGRALLLLRRWGAFVIQAIAALGILWFVGGTAVFLAEVVALAPGQAQRGTATGFMLAIGLFTGLFYGTPLFLTIYHLRKWSRILT